MKDISELQFKQAGAVLLLFSGIVMSLVAPFYPRGMEGIQQLAYILITGGLTAARFESTEKKSISISQTYPTFPPNPNQFPSEYVSDSQPIYQQPPGQYPYYPGQYPPPPSTEYTAEYQRYGNPNQGGEGSSIKRDSLVRDEPLVREGMSLIEDGLYKGEY